MNADKAFAKSRIFLKMLDGGDTGRGRVEHRSFLELRFTHTFTKQVIGQIAVY
jgi:hypothetical protein